MEDEEREVWLLQLSEEEIELLDDGKAIQITYEGAIIDQDPTFHLEKMPEESSR